METIENKNNNEMDGATLYLEYENGCRSVQEFNEKLSKHYNHPISMDKEIICGILQKRAQIFAGSFNPDDITK